MANSYRSDIHNSIHEVLGPGVEAVAHGRKVRLVRVSWFAEIAYVDLDAFASTQLFPDSIASLRLVMGRCK